MIYTITLSPTIDLKVEVDSFDYDKAIQANWWDLQAGGKGINISLVLNQLKIKNTPLVVVGGKTKKLFLDLLEAKITNSVIFSTNKNVRINFKGHSKDNELIINTKSDVQEFVIIEEIKKYLETNIKDGDYVIFSGNPSKGYREDIFYYLAKDINTNYKLVLDIDYEFMFPILGKLDVFLIVASLQILKDLIKKKVNNFNDVNNGVQEIMQKGLENIIIVMSKEGSIFYNRKGERDILTLDEKINVLDQTGGSSSMIAAFIASHSLKQDNSTSHKWAIAAELATITSKEIMKKKEFEKWLKLL